MAALRWSPEALDDVERIHAFLLPKSEKAAARAVAAIHRGVATLRILPQGGRPVNALPEAFREWAIRFGNAGYWAFYRYDGTDVLVLAVRHFREAGYRFEATTGEE